MEVEIDHDLSAIIARRQPAAVDLRTILTITKIVNDLERVGDEVKKIAKQIKDVYDSQVSDDDSLIMEARQDPPTARIPDEVQKAYEPKSKEAFRKMTAATSKLNSATSLASALVTNFNTSPGWSITSSSSNVTITAPVCTARLASTPTSCRFRHSTSRCFVSRTISSAARTARCAAKARCATCWAATCRPTFRPWWSRSVRR